MSAEDLKKLIEQNKKENLPEILRLATERSLNTFTPAWFSSHAVHEKTPTDQYAFKCMLVASLQSGADVTPFEEDMKKMGMQFELALAFYNKQQYDKALPLLQSAEKDKILKAQIVCVSSAE